MAKKRYKTVARLGSLVIGYRTADNDLLEVKAGPVRDSKGKIAGFYVCILGREIAFYDGERVD